MAAPREDRQLQCLEVWGGNEPARQSVSLSGLDAWVEAIPHAKSAAGGDVHYLSSCAAGMVTRMFLADVSGHGSGVADIARALRVLMRQHVNHHNQVSFVKRMNKTFTEQSAAGIFATAVVCTFYAPKSELSLCNAGHPPPLWYRAATQRWELLVGDESRDEDHVPSESPANIPLGILDMASYDQLRVKLADGDRVLCYTDSLIEARDAAGEMLGSDGVLQVANALPATSPAEFMDAFWTALRQRAGDTLLNDDVTMLLITPNRTTRRDTFWNKAYSPIRVILHFLTHGSDDKPRFANR
jgi:serine phosphatase RsbU (regulator of sigma subunit)